MLQVWAVMLQKLLSLRRATRSEGKTFKESFRDHATVLLDFCTGSSPSSWSLAIYNIFGTRVLCCLALQPAFVSHVIPMCHMSSDQNAGYWYLFAIYRELSYLVRDHCLRSHYGKYCR